MTPTHRSRTAATTVLSLALLSLVMTSCGGGGGDGSDPRFLGGIWTGVVLRTDSCGIDGAQTVNVTHTVNQNEEAIVLVDQNNVQYIGNTVGNNGFSVDAPGQLTVGNQLCASSNRIEYHDIDDDDDPSATVEFRFTANCPAANGCDVTYSGTASRTIAGATPAATLTPSGTVNPGTTPVSGGCAAMNTNPAAGTFSGDGGCGISNAGLTISTQGGNTVAILEPFGVNGATSFVINPAAPSSASSARTDLTINGAAGNSCTMACNPPGTFTISCFREGGTQCSEKF